MDHATLYLSRPLTTGDARVDGVELTPGTGPLFAEATVLGTRVRLSALPAADLPRHLQGLAEHVRAQLPGHTPAVFDRIAAVAQVLGVAVEPGFDEDGEVLSYLHTLALRGEGFVFENGELIGPAGETVAGLDPLPAPPDADRVLRRAWALAAVVWRGFAETSDDELHVRRSVERVQRWVEDVGLEDELEPDELELLEAPPGTLDAQAVVNSTWRLEGLAVLAWSLGVAALPDHETQCDPPELLRAVGFMVPRPSALEPPRLRSPDELAWLQRRLLGLHWRLREHQVNPGTTNLRKLAGGEIWFGGFDLDGIALAGDDLAIGGQPIHRADPERVQACSSIAVERHTAINWLLGDAELYSDVDTST